MDDDEVMDAKLKRVCVEMEAVRYPQQIREEMERVRSHEEHTVTDWSCHREESRSPDRGPEFTMVFPAHVGTVTVKRKIPQQINTSKMVIVSCGILNFESTGYSSMKRQPIHHEVYGIKYEVHRMCTYINRNTKKIVDSFYKNYEGNNLRIGWMKAAINMTRRSF